MHEPFIQKVPPSNRPTQTLTLFSYAGGLDNVSSETTTKNECATNVLNMEFIEDGLIQKRFGTKRSSFTALNKPFTYFDVFSPNGEPEMKVTCTTSEMFVNDVKICDVGGTIQGITINNAYWFVDGVKLRSYEKVGSTWKVLEIKQPTNLEDTLSAKATKNDTFITVANPSKFKAGQYIQLGKREVKNAEGIDDKPLPQTVRVLKIEGSKVHLGEMITSEYIKYDSDGNPSKIEKQEEAKTKLQFDYESGSTVVLFAVQDMFKYVGDWKSDATSKWYEPCAHELQDPYKGTNLIPQNPKYISYIKNRLVLAGMDNDKHTLYISDINNPYYCPVSLGLSLPANGDRITGLSVFHDSLIIARAYDMYVVYGSTNNPELPDQFSMKKITTHTGCSNGRTIQVVHNYLFYLGTDGVVYRMTTTNTDVQLLMTQVVTQTVDMKKKPLSLTENEFNSACSCFTNNHYYLQIGKYTFVYSYRFMAWTVFDQIDAVYMCTINSEVYWIRGNSVCQFDTTSFLDEGMCYKAIWESKLFDLSAPTIFKYFKYISLVFETYEDFDSKVDITFEIDYEDVYISTLFKNQIGRWGKMQWGDRFANRNVNKSVPIYVGRRGRLVKVKLGNGYKVKYVLNTFNDVQTKEVNINDVIYCLDTKKHYKLTQYYDYAGNSKIDWLLIETSELNQPVKLYNVEIEYSLRGRR